MGRGNNIIKVFLLILIINFVWFSFLGFQYYFSDKTQDGFGNDTAGRNEEKLKDSSTAAFYSDNLSEQEQGYFDQLYQCLIHREEKTELGNCSEEQLEKVWQAVLFDHPEIFWCNSYQYLEYQDDTPRLEIRPQYVYSSKEIDERITQIESAAEEFIKGVDKEASDYDKVKAVYDYIIDNTDYDSDSKNNQNIDSVFIGGSSVCAGYAKATKYLLEKLEVPSVVVQGSAVTDSGGEGEAHAWNIVESDGVFFHVDTTWGDPVFSNAMDKTGTENVDYIAYEYLGCNDEQIFKNHIEDGSYAYPGCSSMEFNYFVVNNRYFDEYDENKLLDLLKQDADSQAKFTSFMFSDKKAYETAVNDINNIMGKSGFSGTKFSFIKNDKMQVLTLLLSL